MRDRLAEVLIEHTRRDIGHCHCGWGVDTGHAGKSHAHHVADALLPEIRAEMTRAVDRVRALASWRQHGEHTREFARDILRAIDGGDG